MYIQIICILVPISIFTVYYFFRRDVYDLHHAILGKLIPSFQLLIILLKFQIEIKTIQYY